jgi:hypothetical protein
MVSSSPAISATVENLQNFGNPQIIDSLFAIHSFHDARSQSIEGRHLIEVAMRRMLIVRRKPRLHLCAPFVLTGWAKLEDLHMFKGDSFNPPAL